MTVEADPVGQRIDLELVWDRRPPAPEAGLAAGGFALTPEVVAVRDRWHVTDQQEEAHVHNSHIQARVDDLHQTAAGGELPPLGGLRGRSARPLVRAVRELVARWITGARPLRTHP